MRPFILSLLGVLTWILISRTYFVCKLCPSCCGTGVGVVAPVAVDSLAGSGAIKGLSSSDTMITLPTKTIESIPVTESTVSIEKMVEKGETFNFTNMNFTESNFNTNSDKFEPVPEFVAYSDSLIHYCQLTPSAKVTIVGHTDIRASDAFNDKLGLHRAESVKRYLTEKGLSGDRVIVESKGKREPRVPNDSRANMAKNRRINVLIKV